MQYRQRRTGPCCDSKWGDDYSRGQGLRNEWLVPHQNPRAVDSSLERQAEQGKAKPALGVNMGYTGGTQPNWPVPCPAGVEKQLYFRKVGRRSQFGGQSRRTYREYYVVANLLFNQLRRMSLAIKYRQIERLSPKIWRLFKSVYGRLQIGKHLTQCG